MSQIAHSFGWSALERFSVQGINFLLSIIIARMVSPSSYGLIVIVQIFLSFSQVFIDGGFVNALIQKKDRDETDYCTVFFFNLGVAVCLYLLLFLFAPIIAGFYEEPQLILITRVISLNLIFSSLSLVQKTRLTIDLDFKTQSKASLIAAIISGILGIFCAYFGLEVWALVIQGLVNQLMITIALILYSRWKPKPIFSIHSFIKLFTFGSKLMINNILTSIYVNITNLVIGKKYSSSDLAFYNRGFTLSQFPSANLSEVMNRVIYPILVKVQDDKESLKNEYLKYLHLSYYIILPLMGGLLVLSEPLVEVVLTSKWIDAVPYIQIFCLNFMLYPLQLQTGNPVAAIGHSGVLLKAQVIKRIVSFVILVVSLTISVPAVCWGILISSIFETMINIYVCEREIGVGFILHIKNLKDIIFTVSIMCMLVTIVTSFITAPFIKLLIGVVLGIIICLLGTWLLNMQEKYYLVNIINEVKYHVEKH